MGTASDDVATGTPHYRELVLPSVLRQGASNDRIEDAKVDRRRTSTFDHLVAAIARALRARLDLTVVKVLIAGCGYVGTALGQELIAQGHSVWGLRRTPSTLPAGFHPLALDLAAPEGLRGMPAEIDRVVYCASADEASDAAYARAYVTGLANVLRAVASSAVERILFTSSTAVYAQSEGEWVDESSPTAPSHFSGVRLLEAEALLRAQAIPSSSLRCSGIYGPGRTRLISTVRDGTARGSGRYTNRIHRDDISGAIVHLLDREPLPPVLLLSDDEPATEHTVQCYLARRLGLPEPPLTEGEPRSRGGHKRCRNRLLAATGYRLRFPTYREGYAAMLENL
jgi:nucleoside-diphosphate-sugar epimerase